MAQLMVLHVSGSDVFGNTSGSGDASGGLYGEGKYGYSINESHLKQA